MILAYANTLVAYQTRYINPMLVWLWPIIYDAGPTFLPTLYYMNDSPEDTNIKFKMLEDELRQTNSIHMFYI